MVGQTLNHYRILSRLGKGGMGEVFVAEDTRLNRRVALKVLPPRLASNPLFLKRFQREAKAVAALSHPNIVTIHSVEEADGGAGIGRVHFLTMQLLEGKSLADLIPPAGSPGDSIVDIGLQVTDALGAAHDRGIVHRDLKPQNIMVQDDGRVSILDFGLARVELPGASGGDDEKTSGDEDEDTVLTAEGAVLGTVAYMSPEQAKGKRVDQRTDIFSLGIILYEMAAGRRPFQGQSSAEILSALLRDAPVPVGTLRSDLHPALASAIGRCLEKDVGLRVQSAAELQAALRSARTPSSMSLSEVPSTTPSAPRPRWRWPVTATFGVAALAIALLFVHGKQPELGQGAVAGGPPAGAGVAPGLGASGRPAIAVMQFASHGSPDSQWLSSGVPDMLLTGLAQTPGLDVIGTERVMQTVARSGARTLAAVDRSQWGDIARSAGAGAMVVGSTYELGEDVRIDVRIEDLTSGRVLAAESVNGRDVFRLVDELTDRVRRTLSVEGVATGPRIADVTTSLEAYRLFSEGLEAHRYFHLKQARERFQKAVAIDPHFALAHFYLAQVESSNEARERAFQTASGDLLRLPERQQHLVRMGQAVRAGNLAEAEAVGRQLVDHYPDMEDAYTALSDIYWHLHRLDDVVATCERGVRALPKSGPLRCSLGWGLQETGQYEAATKEMLEYARLSPGEPDPLDSIGTSYLVAGEPAKAIASYTQAVAMDYPYSYFPMAFAHAATGAYDEALADLEELDEKSAPGRYATSFYLGTKAWLLARVGRYREAELTLDERRRESEQSGQTDGIAMSEVTAAQLAMERGEASRAIRALERLRALVPELPAANPPSWEWTSQSRATMAVLADSYQGIVEARAGRLEEARARLGAARELPRSRYAEPLRLFLQGEIALAERDFDAAALAFAAAEPRGRRNFLTHPTVIFADWRGRLASARGDVDAAIAAYRDVLRPGPHCKWVVVFEPRYVLALARLLDTKGDAAAARREWERFADLWKSADPDLPELAEARRRLAR